MQRIAYLFLLALVLVISGCGQSSADESEPGTLDEMQRGKELFQASCRACHALADANAAGVFGPDLDLLQPDAERVREQIRDGGGGMPDDILDGEDAELVAAYIAEVAGGNIEGDKTASQRGGVKPSDR